MLGKPFDEKWDIVYSLLPLARESLLDERQEDILKRCYGITPYEEPQELKEIATALDLGVERTHYWLSVAMSKLEGLQAGLRLSHHEHDSPEQEDT